MEGSGAYNRNSRVQAAGLAAAIPLFRGSGANMPRSATDAGADCHCRLWCLGRSQLAWPPWLRLSPSLRQRVGRRTRHLGHPHRSCRRATSTRCSRRLPMIPTAIARGDAAGLSVRRRAQLLRTDPAVRQRDARLDVLGGAMAEPHSRAASPITSRLPTAATPRRARCLRRTGRCGLARLPHPPRARNCVLAAVLVVLTMALTDAGDFGYRAVLAAIYGALKDLVAEGEISDAGTCAHGRSRPSGAAVPNLLAPFDAVVAISPDSPSSSSTSSWARIASGSSMNGTEMLPPMAPAGPPFRAHRFSRRWR